MRLSAAFLRDYENTKTFPNAAMEATLSQAVREIPDRNALI
jgi:hypothetical protein